MSAAPGRADTGWRRSAGRTCSPTSRHPACSRTRRSRRGSPRRTCGAARRARCRKSRRPGTACHGGWDVSAGHGAAPCAGRWHSDPPHTPDPWQQGDRLRARTSGRGRGECGAHRRKEMPPAGDATAGPFDFFFIVTAGYATSRPATLRHGRQLYRSNQRRHTEEYVLGCKC